MKKTKKIETAADLRLIKKIEIGNYKSLPKKDFDLQLPNL